MERRRSWAESWAPIAAGLVVGIALALGAWWMMTQRGGDSGAAAFDPGPVHVHALGVDPADGALFVATHTGLYRVGEGEDTARRVSDRHQDTMGFTVAGPNRFLGSGHPDLRDDLPPLLDLIESSDAGRSWSSVSLLGEADFHVLRVAGERVYGYDASNDRLLASADGGRTWQELERPGPIVDLAVSPLEPTRLVAAAAGGSGAGLFESRDGGESWAPAADVVGLLAWPTPERLYVVAGDGDVLMSADGGRSLRPLGAVGGEPAAFLAASAAELYVALHDGTIKRSADGGATWAVRSTP